MDWGNNLSSLSPRRISSVTDLWISIPTSASYTVLSSAFFNFLTSPSVDMDMLMCAGVLSARGSQASSISPSPPLPSLLLSPVTGTGIVLEENCPIIGLPSLLFWTRHVRQPALGRREQAQPSLLCRARPLPNQLESGFIQCLCNTSTIAVC